VVLKRRLIAWNVLQKQGRTAPSSPQRNDPTTGTAPGGCQGTYSECEQANRHHTDPPPHCRVIGQWEVSELVTSWAKRPPQALERTLEWCCLSSQMSQHGFSRPASVARPVAASAAAVACPVLGQRWRKQRGRTCYCSHCSGAWVTLPESLAGRETLPCQRSFPRALPEGYPSA